MVSDDDMVIVAGTSVPHLAERISRFAPTWDTPGKTADLSFVGCQSQQDW
jgi:hypothetical protein